MNPYNFMDPETLRLIDLYFGGQNRMPAPIPRRKTTKEKPKKPTTRIRPTLSISPQQVMAAGGRPVEAEDIALNFNRALQAGEGYGAFQGIPPELRESLLGGIMRKPEKAKKKKLPDIDRRSEGQIIIDLVKAGVPKNAAAMVWKAFQEGQFGVLKKNELDALPGMNEALARLGMTETVRDAQTPKPTNRIPAQRYLEATTDRGPTGEGQGTTTFRPMQEPVGMPDPAETYWNRRANTPEDMAKYAYTERRVPTTQGGLSIGLEANDRDLMEMLIRRLIGPSGQTDPLMTPELSPNNPVQQRQLPAFMRSLWEDAGPTYPLDVRRYLSGG